MAVRCRVGLNSESDGAEAIGAPLESALRDLELRRIAKRPANDSVAFVAE